MEAWLSIACVLNTHVSTMTLTSVEPIIAANHSPATRSKAYAQRRRQEARPAAAGHTPCPTRPERSAAIGYWAETTDMLGSPLLIDSRHQITRATQATPARLVECFGGGLRGAVKHRQQVNNAKGKPRKSCLLCSYRQLCCVPFKSWTRVHEFTTGEKAFHSCRELVNS